MKNSNAKKEGLSTEEEPPPLPEKLSLYLTGFQIDWQTNGLLSMKERPSWQNWHWQMQHRIRTVQQLLDFFPGFTDIASVANSAAKFPMAITPYYASLIKKFDASDPIFRMSVPQSEELYDPPYLMNDPLAEETDSPVPNLVHRYPDRAVLLVTSVCAMYCRHCTRKRLTGCHEHSISDSNLEKAVAYLNKHPEIHDVVISGGDPLTLSTERLETILQSLRTVPSVKVLRIGTRMPVTLPFRIRNELVRMLKKYHPVWINTHFNHPIELTPEAIAACTLIADAGIPLGNQTVLLRGVNDQPELMAELFRRLVAIRVRPYYIFQCDLARGVEHLRTPITKGIEIMEYLRGHLSGIAIPSYVVDMPYGGGKIPLLPNYILSTSPGYTVLRNYKGMIVSYPEPAAAGASDSSGIVNNYKKPIESVSDLSRGLSLSLNGEASLRKKFRRIFSQKNLISSS